VTHPFLFTVKTTGEQIKVRTSYPEDVSIITYSNLISQDTWEGIAYTYIDSKMITDAIKKVKIIELESDFWSTMRKYHKDVNHVDIITNLIRLIPINGCEPLCYDTFSRDVSNLDGHHRLITLCFINRNKDDFLIPISLNGIVSELERLFTPLECDYTPC
jgi:hypothetical protein